MIILNLNYDITLNPSLQVGDLVYACPTTLQAGAETEQHDSVDSNGMGVNNIVGVLRRIDIIEAQPTAPVLLGQTTFLLQTKLARLYVDNSMLDVTYIPVPFSDFIMFSKYSQGDAGVLGYYADVKLVNNSKEKAELFAVSSEVIINSK